MPKKRIMSFEKAAPILKEQGFYFNKHGDLIRPCRRASEISYVIAAQYLQYFGSDEEYYVKRFPNFLIENKEE